MQRWNETLLCDHHVVLIITPLPIEQYYHAELFIMLYKVVVTFQSVDETLECDNQMKAFE